MSLDLVNKAPAGTKLWILDLGSLECDEAYLKRGAGALSKSNPDPPHRRRKLSLTAALIKHPIEGLILYETGGGKDYPEVWGPPLNDLFPQVDYMPEQELGKQIELTGNSIKDIKMVLLSRLHLDHADGLEWFAGTDVPIYVHEQELKHAFFSVANKSDMGVYLAKDLRFDINWRAFSDDYLEITAGINVHHSPGHTPGLCIMQVNLDNSGTWIFTSDQFHVQENYWDATPQGWLARDHDDWIRSSQKIHMMESVKMVFGHCWATVQKHQLAPHAYD